MQKIHKLIKPFPHLIVENMYENEELNLIWEELEFLTQNKLFQSPEIYGAAYDINLYTGEKEYKTNSKAITLDDLYKDRNISNILNLNRKLFAFKEIYYELSEYHSKFLHSNYDITRIRYYQNKDKYPPHLDVCFDTLACTYFYKEPQKFNGGQLFFPEHNGYEIDCKNNLCVIFPAYFVHAVQEVKMSDVDYDSGFGRYCMSQFTNVISF